MNRINRLTAILIHLQSKRIVTAKEIAERFGISSRTVYRDIRALEDAGVPIGAEAGKGYFIVEGYHLPPMMLTKEEAGALLMGAKLIERFSDSSVKAHFDTSLYKIKSVLKTQDKDYLNTLDAHIEVLDQNHRIREGFPDNFLSDIQSVVGKNKVIQIHYHSGYKNEVTSRLIEPMGLCFYSANWHLIAYCRLRNDYRDFRVDRIKNTEMTDIFFDSTRHDSLQNLIQKIVVSEDLKPVTVRFQKDVGNFIHEDKYYRGFVSQKDAGKYLEMNFMVNSYYSFANWLINFENKVEVISPEELKKGIRDRIIRLHRHYVPPEKRK